MEFVIDIGRLQLAVGRFDKGARAASERLGGVGATKASCDHEWHREVASVSTCFAYLLIVKVV